MIIRRTFRRTLLRRIFLLLFPLALLACEERGIGREDAAPYFAERREAFEEVVRQVAMCRPSGHRIRLDEDPGSGRCQSANGDADALIVAMRDARATLLLYDFGSGNVASDAPLARVQVAVHLTGFAFSGTIEEYVYLAEAPDDGSYKRVDDELSTLERHAGTEPPYHWFWQRLTR